MFIGKILNYGKKPKIISMEDWDGIVGLSKEARLYGKDEKKKQFIKMVGKY